MPPTYEIIKDFGVPFVTFVAGSLLGIKTALYFDKRKEFNAIVMDTYFALRRQIDNRDCQIIDINTYAIEPYFPTSQRKSFRECVDRYKTTKYDFGTYYAETGDFVPDESEVAKLVKHASDLLPYLFPR